MSDQKKQNDDLEEVPELDDSFFKDPILTRPGESLIERLEERINNMPDEAKKKLAEVGGDYIRERLAEKPHPLQLTELLPTHEDLLKHKQEQHDSVADAVERDLFKGLKPGCPSCGSNSDVDCVCKGAG